VGKHRIRGRRRRRGEIREGERGGRINQMEVEKDKTERHDQERMSRIKEKCRELRTYKNGNKATWSGGTPTR